MENKEYELEKRYILDIAKYSLLNESFDYSFYNDKNLNHKYIFEKALEQKIENILYYGLEKLDNNSIIFKHLSNIYLKHLITITNQNSEYHNIVELFENNNIDYIPLKGISVKSLYPHEDMRLMGDIDILIHKNQRTKVRKLLTSNDYILDKNSLSGGHHEIFDKNKYGHFEIHYNLFDDKSQKDDFFDKNVWNESLNHQMSIEFNLCFLIAHYYKHFFHGGASFKSMFDILLVLEKYDIDYAKLKSFLDKSNYYVFFNNVTQIINYIFNKNYYLYESFLNEHEIKEIIDYIFICGDFGFGKENDYEKTNVMNSMSNKKINIFTKLGYIIKRVCIPYSTFKNISKIIKYCPILLPFGWVFRFFKYLFKHDKKQIHERLDSINSVTSKDINERKTINRFLNLEGEK